LRNFHHTAWTIENGLGVVSDIQQGPEAYLWLTTSNGILRFDGVRFQSVDEATGGAVHNSNLTYSFVSRDGSLFLSRQSPEFLIWKNGRLTRFSDRRCTPGVTTGGVVEDRDGSLWIQSSGGLSHFRNSFCEHIGNESGYTGGFATAIFMDRRWTLWVKAQSGDLMVLRSGRSKFEFIAHEGRSEVGSAFLHESPDGSIWLSDEQGLRRITDSSGVLLHVAAKRRQLRGTPLRNFTFAADGSLWAVTSEGVERFAGSGLQEENASVDAGEGESFTLQKGLSSDVVWKVFADREGLIWLGTSSGLDQLRHTALSVPPLPRSQQRQFAVAPANAGSAWIGSLSMPLTRVTESGAVKSFPEMVHSRGVYRDPNGEIWAAGFVRSRLWRILGATAIPVPTPHEEVEAVGSVAVDKNGEPWINTFAPNVYRRVDGKWVQQTQTLGREPGVMGTMRGDDAGNVWFAFVSSLVKWDGSKFSRYSSAPVDISVMTLAFRDDRVWIGGAAGIEMFRQGRFQRMRWHDEEMPGRVTGVVETARGDLWVNGFSGILHVAAAEMAKWLRDPGYAVLAERLDAQDGLPGFVAERWPEPSVVESPEGRLWFATSKGVAWLDPVAFDQNRNLLPPPVLITGVNADGTTYPTSSAFRIPALTKNIQIEYTALSFAVPERVRFRYKLEGADDKWQDVGTRREAFFSNLPARRYSFRVTACNNDGVWNDTGAFISFTVMPSFYETWWFRALCVLSFSLLLWLAVRLRIGVITRQLEVRLADRMAERERIARELHDTLLQSFQGLMLRLQAVNDLLPDGKAKERLEQSLERADEAVAEGRRAVYDLRSSTTTISDLADALRSAADEMAGEGSPVFSLLVGGYTRDLNPIVRDEVYRIAREGLRNAYSHSRAKNIEVVITYAERLFQVRIRDDGDGIAPEILEAGRSGHYGLNGMRERARRICARFDLWSGPGTGTAIDLSIPASIAYRKSPSRFRFQLFGLK
jgi:signal transduction histidine kinase/ligand-binding sensor domain-containing protein